MKTHEINAAKTVISKAFRYNRGLAEESTDRSTAVGFDSRSLSQIKPTVSGGNS